MTVELVGTAEGTLQGRTFRTLYAQVQQFYTDQMRILDTPDNERWADTFTEDAVLELPSLPEPARNGSGGPAAA
jgi:3-phenylpropionate/cinnamic acid dioxygenase small subunit